jgi:glycyl-tRNA synthetase beta chain
MAELLLELLSEEVPAHMQARAADDLKRLVTDRLKEAGLDFKRARAFVTPRRLALVVHGLPLRQPDAREERRGPRADAPKKAIEGFLKSAGLTSVDQCEIRQTDKGGFLYAVSKRRGAPTAKVLPLLVCKAVVLLNWPKSMRWAHTSMRWVRPLHNIVAVFDGKRLAGGINTGHPEAFVPAPAYLARNELKKALQSPDQKSITFPYSNKTVGHRFLAPQPIRVKDFADYRAKLRKAKVMLDAAQRRDKIARDAARLAAAEKLAVRPDQGLLDEVAGMVEWPVTRIGAIDEAYMDLPAEVLITVMRHHQRYFSLLRKDGSLAPRFLVVADIEPEDRGKALVAGHERVLRARLADAKFFWDQDRKRTLETRLPKLGELVFHAKLGSIADKVARMQALIAELAWHIPGVDVALGERAALLAKADLVTEMVGEFPELQGVMGRYYALYEGARREVADAIAEHYAPQGPNDRCPTAPVGVAVALADKIDTLVGFWRIDEKPTGSKDPYALRRAALGVIRLIVENELRVPLARVFAKADSPFVEMGARRAGRLDIDDLLSFLADRLKVHLRERGVRHDLVSAVFALGGEDDLVRLLARVAALAEFVETEDGADLLTAYRRASNIVRIEEARDGRSYAGEADPALFVQRQERALYERLAKVRERCVKALASEKWGAAMRALAALRRPVDAFFDHVTVNCPDAKLRKNRLKLLSQIRSTMGTVADFSKIEG